MDTQSELEELIAEQQQDDGYNVTPEFPEQVPFTDELAKCIGVDVDGEIFTNWPRPPKGTVLVGTAPWHGSLYGYKNRRCRCERCTEASAEWQRNYRLNGGS